MSISTSFPGAGTTPETLAQGELGISAFDRYAQLQTDRSQYIWRGRLVGEVTIPYLIPFEEGTSTASEQYMTPKSSIGARGVNNLANKLTLAIMPPGQPFFKLSISPLDLQDLPDDTRGEIEEGLSNVEQTTRIEMERSGLRAPLVDAMRSMIITGNGLLHIDDDGVGTFFRLNQYVVQRDAMGSVLEIILRQSVSARTLPREIQRFLADTEPRNLPNGQQQPAEDSVDVFTRTIRKENRWISWQEMEGLGELPGTRASRPLDSPAWIPLTWQLIAGENYGRGLGEEFQGDLDSNESLQDSLITGAAASARVLWLVNEGGLTQAEEVAEADNGDVIDGREEDVGTLKVDKASDLSVAKSVQENIQRGLASIFLLTSDNIRKAERVTAEEIRLIAQELEQALGGVFSRLAVELQTPLARRYMAILKRKGRLPDLPKEIVSPEVTTGLPALGRFAQLQKYDVLVQGIAELVGQEAAAKKIKLDTLISLRGAELGLVLKDLFRTDEEIAAQDEMAFKRRMAEASVGPTIAAQAQNQQPGAPQQSGPPAAAAQAPPAQQ